MTRFHSCGVTGSKNVSKVLDHQPKRKYEEDLCTTYGNYSDEKSILIANSLNMAHELRQLPPSATKKQQLEIINKYR